MTTTPRIDRIEAGRNFAINGALDFWQRGVGPTAIPSTEYVSGYFLADRYSCRNEVATGVANSLRSTDVPSVSQAGFDFNYSLEVDITTAKPVLVSSDSARFKTILEGYDAVQVARAGFRVQFWVKTNKTGVYTLTGTNLGGSRRYVTSYTVNAADTWELKTADFPPELTGTWNKTNGEGLNILWTHANGISSTPPTGDWLNPGTALAVGQVNLYDNIANYWRITGIMIVPGVFPSDTVLPFTRAGKNIQDELAMCQRYYEKSYDLDIAPGTATAGGSVSFLGGVTLASKQVRHTHVFKVTKRGTPTVVIYAAESGTSGWVVVLNDTGGGVTSIVNSPGPGSFNTNQVTMAQDLNTYAGIRWQFTADAEL